MGIFLSISGILNKSAEEVEHSLRRFASSVNGGLTDDEVEEDHPNLAIISGQGVHTTVLYPNDFVEWDDAGQRVDGVTWEDVGRWSARRFIEAWTCWCDGYRW